MKTAHFTPIEGKRKRFQGFNWVREGRHPPARTRQLCRPRTEASQPGNAHFTPGFAPLQQLRGIICLTRLVDLRSPVDREDALLEPDNRRIRRDPNPEEAVEAEQAGVGEVKAGGNHQRHYQAWQAEQC